MTRYCERRASFLCFSLDITWVLVLHLCGCFPVQPFHCRSYCALWTLACPHLSTTSFDRPTDDHLLVSTTHLYNAQGTLAMFSKDAGLCSCGLCGPPGSLHYDHLLRFYCITCQGRQSRTCECHSGLIKDETTGDIYHGQICYISHGCQGSLAHYISFSSSAEVCSKSRGWLFWQSAS